MNCRQVDDVENSMLNLISKQPVYFLEILEALEDTEYRLVLQAFGNLRRKRVLDRDNKGRYLLKAEFNK